LRTGSLSTKGRSSVQKRETLRMLAEIFGVDGIIVLVVVVLVLFGSTQIPKLARSLGSAQSQFKKGLAEGSQDDETSTAKSEGDASPGKKD
jgi:sec-independent protein translocase protein TatA